MKPRGTVHLETFCLIFASILLCSHCVRYNDRRQLEHDTSREINSSTMRPYIPEGKSGSGDHDNNGSNDQYQKRVNSTAGTAQEFWRTFLPDAVGQNTSSNNIESPTHSPIHWNQQQIQHAEWSTSSPISSQIHTQSETESENGEEIFEEATSPRPIHSNMNMNHDAGTQEESDNSPTTFSISFNPAHKSLSILKSTSEKERDMDVTLSLNPPSLVVKPPTITIIVTGRSGSGVTSTIHELIGHETICRKPNEKGTLTDIMEYTISDIPTESGNSYNLRLIDLPGFVDGRTMEQDAQILATLKSYITLEGPPGPSFFLVLSRFDDNRIFGKHSLFIQLVNRVELFKKMFLDRVIPRKIPFIFLLTRFMSDTKVNQRRPADKISTFRQAVTEYSSSNFSSLVSFVVGENKANSEHNAKVENGYYKLPNKEFYPKNVWQAMMNEANLLEDKNVLEVLTSLMKNREVKMTCNTKIIKTHWEHYDEDADAFEYLLNSENNTIVETGVNHQIDFTYGRKGKSRSKYVEEIIQKSALQLYLQNENYLEKPHLPTEYEEKAAFFQKSTLVSGTIPALILDETFKLKMPEYIEDLSVGYGYAVLADEKTLVTPFETTFLPSPVGYQLPNFMKCRKFPRQETEDFMVYSHNISDYFSTRLDWLHFPGKENVSLAKFDGKVKEGFNVPPESASSIASLTGVKETRMIKCTLSASRFLTLNDDFLATMDDLSQFDASDRESVADWNNFFSRFGTHIISTGFGGGRLHGSIVGPKVLGVMENQEKIEATLHSVMKFAPFPEPDFGIPKYRFYGGQLPSDSDTEKLYEMPDADRDELFKNWRNSLSSNFMMLKNEFELEPISSIVKEKIGVEEGTWVEEATSLFLRGELEFKNARRRNKNTKTKRTKTDRTLTNQQKITIAPARLPALITTPSTDSESNLDSAGSARSFDVGQIQASFKDLDFIVNVSRGHQETMNVVNFTLQRRRNEDERTFQLRVRDFERRKQERQRISINQLEELERQSRTKKEEMGAAYNRRLMQIQQQNALEEKSFQDQLEELRRRNEEEEERHQQLLQLLEKRRKEEEEKLRQKQRNKCSWFGSCAWEYIRANVG